MHDSWFQRSYWCGVNVKGLTDDLGEDSPLLRDHSVPQNPEYFEKEPLGLKAGIQIQKLQKVCEGVLLGIGRSFILLPTFLFSLLFWQIPIKIGIC